MWEERGSGESRVGKGGRGESRVGGREPGERNMGKEATRSG